LIMLWVFTLTDLAHRRDVSGVAKGFWAVAIVLLPLIGMLIYFITRPEDDIAIGGLDVVAGSAGPLEITDGDIAELEKLGKLKDDGAITDEEFSKMKARILD
ncbi:MAG: SHOCT domain-containing protein, partial [Actinomycetota bacterium]